MAIAMWRMDVIVPIDPKGSNDNHFIFTVIDYFTKWIEVSSFNLVTKEVIMGFIRGNIMYRYGELNVIIFDNAKNLNNSMMLVLQAIQHQASEI